MGLSAGDRIGAYEVAAPLGAGGMGEVYRARDTRLKRDVALKILPDTLSDDAERVARFQREAELLATLNHPNIASIFGLEEGGGRSAIVMELVEGETLADLIASTRGQGLPLDDALPIAKQIAEALEAAHERGVIHRDLKPANVKLTPGGTVKVLDFGLAKLLDGSPAASSLSMSPTLSVHATYAGVILGTASYMSPEQARGKPVDRRTDVWAFGCVLFEMLTGTQALGTSGETVSDAVAAILRGEPDWASLPPDTPPNIRRLLRRCLVKDPRGRLHDIADARLEIDDVASLQPPAGSSVTRRPARGNQWWRTASIVAGVALAGVLAALLVRGPEAPPAPLVRLDLVVPASTDALSPALSPDGRRVAFVANGSNGTAQLWVRDLDQTEPRPLGGTDRATFPFWSPDSNAVGFFSDGKLRRTDLGATTTQVLADAPIGRGGTWSSNGTIVFAPSNSSSSLMQVRATGGQATPITSLGPGHGVHLWPQFLPDGRRFLFAVLSASPDTRGTYVGSLDGGELVRVAPTDTAALYASPGWLVSVRQGTLVAYPFDSEAARVSGEARPLSARVGVSDAYGRPALTAAREGVIIYNAQGGTQRRQLAWYGRDGRALGAVGVPETVDMPSIALAPDQRRIAAARTTQGNQDIWVIDLETGIPARLTFHPTADNAPVWSPDGERVFFRSLRTGLYDLFAKPSTGAGDETPVALRAQPAGAKMAYDTSGDGQLLVFGAVGPDTGADIWAVPLTKDPKPFPVVQTPFAEDAAQLSPDGRWLAYESNESGQFEVYVQAFPVARGKWQISTAGGIHPRWRGDGQELFFVAPDGRLMAASLTILGAGQSVQAGQPKPLFTPRFASGGNIIPPGGLARPLYVVTRDGRFLVNEAAGDDQATSVALSVLLNWDAELRDR